MQQKTLVYSPDIRVIIESDGVQHDISGDVISATINRRLDTTSDVSLMLSNKNLRYNNKFKRMDKIEVSLKRTSWVKVITGYLDSVPVMQLYPGAVTITASCTLKRIVHTWFDPKLPASQLLLWQEEADQQQASQVLSAAGQNSADPAASAQDALSDSPNTSMALTKDAGLGFMLKKVMVEIGGWDEEELFVQDVPTQFIEYLAENLDKYENGAAQETFKELFGWNETVKSSTVGGGDLSSINFSDIGPPANGVAYSMDEIVQIVEAAGWTGDDIAIGAAIIMAESQGNPAAVNAANANGTTDRGLWQINSIHDGKRNGGDWFDPAVSTRMARQIYQEAGNSWTPWSTYSYFGSYQKYMPQAREAAARLKSNPDRSVVKKNNTGGGVGFTSQQTIDASKIGQNPLPGVTLGPSKKKSGVAVAKQALDLANALAGNLNNTLAAGEQFHNGADPDKKSGQNDIAEIPSPAPTVGSTGNAYISGLGGKAPNTSGMRVCDSIAAVALYKFPMMSYTSGERYTDSGYHSKSMAADISNGGNEGTPEMKQLAQWWVDNFLGKGLLQLIHRPFMHNVYEDQDIGDGVSIYGNGTMEEHRNHVHIAMAGVVSVDGTSDGNSVASGAAGTTYSYENKLGKSLFNYIFQPFDNDTAGIANLFTDERAPINDEPLVKTVNSICSASMRRYQSSPDGGFVAFYPDYFGLDGGEAVLSLEDIELKDVQINASDNSFTTHAFVRGNEALMGLGFQGEYGWLGSRGIATIENEWLFKRMAEATLVKPEFETANEIMQRYGLRPLVQHMSNVTTPEMEFLAACKLFIQKWAEQYSTRIEMTFMPELFPGMRVDLAGHGVTVFVESVTHNISFESGGFTTTAVINSPSPSKGSVGLIPGAR